MYIVPSASLYHCTKYAHVPLTFSCPSMRLPSPFLSITNGQEQSNDQKHIDKVIQAVITDCQRASPTAASFRCPTWGTGTSLNKKELRTEPQISHSDALPLPECLSSLFLPSSKQTFFLHFKLCLFNLLSMPSVYHPSRCVFQRGAEYILPHRDVSHPLEAMELSHEDKTGFRMAEVSVRDMSEFKSHTMYTGVVSHPPRRALQSSSRCLHLGLSMAAERLLSVTVKCTVTI